MPAMMAGRPISTASAPRASILSTSAPERTPPSASTVICFTLRAMAGSASAVPGTASKARPPWLETTMASQPHSSAASASSTLSTPLSMNFRPRACAFSTMALSSARLLGDTGRLLLARAVMAAVSISMPTTPQPARATRSRRSKKASPAQGLMTGMPQPSTASTAFSPHSKASDVPSPVQAMLPAERAPSVTTWAKRSSGRPLPILKAVPARGAISTGRLRGRPSTSQVVSGARTSWISRILRQTFSRAAMLARKDAAVRMPPMPGNSPAQARPSQWAQTRQAPFMRSRAC